MSIWQAAVLAWVLDKLIWVVVAVLLGLTLAKCAGVGG